MKKGLDVSLIVCPNGFGHFKRAALLASKLIANGFSVHIITHAKKWEQFCISAKPINVQLDKVKIENYDWLPVARDYQIGTDNFARFDALVKGQAGRIIISDNYLEPMIANPNSIVLANFFWHEVFEMPAEYHTALNVIKRDKNAKVITTMFGSPHVNSFANVYCVPLFGESQPQLDPGGYVIFTLGFGVWTTGHADTFQRFMNDNASEMPRKIVLDPNLKKKFFKKRSNLNFEYRPFTRDLIAHAEAIVGRPSLGIVTDAFATHVPFIPLADNDAESIHNSNVVKDYYAKLKITNNFGRREIMREELRGQSPSFGGEDALIKLILNSKS